MYNQMHDDTSPWIRNAMERWGPLLTGIEPTSYPKDTSLFSQGQPADYVYIIQTGRVGVFSIMPNGDVKQIYIGDTGSILGEIACIRRQPYISFARAMTACKAYKIPFERLLEEMQRDWNIAEMVIHSISRKAGLLHYQVLEMGFATTFNKTVRCLIHLAKEYGQEENNELLITIKFTHEEVANLINAGRTNVSSIFSKLAKDGVIEKVGGHYIIKDFDRLLDLEKESSIYMY